MTFSEEQVEWIVVEVIRRLRLLEKNNDGVAVGERSSTTAAASTELKLSERLITTKTIEGRLAGVSRLVVRSRAVITPAVKDELKRNKIVLVRDTD